MRRADPAKVKQLVSDLKSGKTIQESLLAAGYSENVAKKGRESLPKEVKAELAKIELRGADRLIELGKNVSPEMVVNLVKGRLAQNLMDGEDNAVNSAKALGSWREVDMFKNETVSGVIMLAPPMVTRPLPVNESKLLSVETLECTPLPSEPAE